eukprot:2356876-Amphidinium_carterae.1
MKRTSRIQCKTVDAHKTTICRKTSFIEKSVAADDNDAHLDVQHHIVALRNASNNIHAPYTVHSKNHTLMWRLYESNPCSSKQTTAMQKMTYYYVSCLLEDCLKLRYTMVIR